jgi:hypothetical protein
MIPFELLGYAMVLVVRLVIDFLIVIENYGTDIDGGKR